MTTAKDVQAKDIFSPNLPKRPSLVRRFFRRIRDASFATFTIIALLFALVGFFAGVQVRYVVLPPKVVYVSPSPEKSTSPPLPSSVPNSPSSNGTGVASKPTVVPVKPQTRPKTPSSVSSHPAPRKPTPAPLPRPSSSPLIKLCLPKLPIIGRVGINCDK